jgi:hypothetical protein
MLEVSYKFLIILAIIAIGYAAKRFKLLQKADGDALTKIVLNFTLPALVISVFSEVKLETSYIMFPALGILIGAVMLGASFIVYRKLDKRDKGILTMPLAVPLVQVIWGDAAIKYLLLIDVGNALIIFALCYIVGAYYANDKEDMRFKHIAAKTLRSIPLLAYVLTMALKLSGIYYPKFIVDIAQIVAKANTAISMLTLGVFLSFAFNRSQIIQLLKFWATKYILGFALGLLVYFFAPISQIEKVVVLMAFILPSSFAVIAYAVEFKYDTKFAGALVNSSIVLSIVFMWVIALVLR